MKESVRAIDASFPINRLAYVCWAKLMSNHLLITFPSLALYLRSTGDDRCHAVQDKGCSYFMLLFIYLLDITFPSHIYIDTWKLDSRSLSNANALHYEHRCMWSEEARVWEGDCWQGRHGRLSCFLRVCVLVALVSEERSTAPVRGSTFSEGTHRQRQRECCDSISIHRRINTNWKFIPTNEGYNVVHGQRQLFR